MEKREFNKIKKRILAQVYSSAQFHVECDLMTLWSEIKKRTTKKDKIKMEKENIIETFVNRYWIEPNIFIKPILKVWGKPTTKKEMISKLKGNNNSPTR